MQKSLKTLLGIEKDSQFSTRVIILSLPSALLFIALAAFKLLSPWMAFLCYAFIIVFNMFSLFSVMKCRYCETMFIRFQMNE